MFFISVAFRTESNSHKMNAMPNKDKKDADRNKSGIVVKGQQFIIFAWTHAKTQIRNTRLKIECSKFTRTLKCSRLSTTNDSHHFCWACFLVYLLQSGKFRWQRKFPLSILIWRIFQFNSYNEAHSNNKTILAAIIEVFAQALAWQRFLSALFWYIKRINIISCSAELCVCHRKSFNQPRWVKQTASISFPFYWMIANREQSKVTERDMMVISSTFSSRIRCLKRMA